MYRLLIEPGVVTGNYYHKETFIMFSVESGEIDATFVQVKTGERTDSTIQAQKQAVHVPPFNALAVANVSDQPAVLYIFSNKRLRGNDDLAYPIKHISEDDPTKTQYH
jgi:dTDP-4-dehydrorhamnose 3,5-epimerase-like enzyme